MSKETEEFVLIGIVALFVLTMLNGNSSGNALTLGLAKINASQDTSYANDVTSVVTSAFDNFS